MYQYQLTVFVQPNLTLDLAFSLYVLRHLLEKGELPSKRFYYSRKIIVSKEEISPIINFNSLILALNKLNNQFRVLLKF